MRIVNGWQEFQNLPTAIKRREIIAVRDAVDEDGRAEFSLWLVGGDDRVYPFTTESFDSADDARRALSRPRRHQAPRVLEEARP